MSIVWKETDSPVKEKVPDAAIVKEDHEQSLLRYGRININGKTLI